jgi:uncharacterized protein YdaU (DUF1376 family)
MTCTEVGAYIRLLSHCWLSGPIPVDAERRARLMGLDLLDAQRAWITLAPKFCETDRGFVNARMETERRKQKRFFKQQSRKATHRWDLQRQEDDAVALPDASHGITLHSSSSSSDPDPEDRIRKDRAKTPPKRVVSAPDASPIVLSYPTVGTAGSVWHFTEAHLQRLSELYPNIGVLQEARKGLAWIEAHPKRRKTFDGMPQFLVNWLNNAVNRQGGSQGPADSSRRRTAAETTLETYRRVEGGH